jgi:hypothetical protein
MRIGGTATVGALLAAAAIAGCGGSSSSSDKAHRDYVAGCVNGGQTKAGCECLWNHLSKKEGIDSEAKMKNLSDRIRAATQAPNPAAAMPPEFRRAAFACQKALLRR